MLVENFVCCVCVERRENLTSITKEGTDNVTYIDKLRSCVSSQEWSEDYHICEKCLEKLDEAYKFIQQCLKSEELRKNLIKESLLIKVEDNKVRWPCQHCLETFATKASVQRHIIRKHTKNEEVIIINQDKTKNNKNAFLCEYCEETFTARSSVRRHIARRHKQLSAEVKQEKNELKSEGNEEQMVVINDIEDSIPSAEAFNELPQADEQSLVLEGATTMENNKKRKLKVHNCPHCSELFNIQKDLKVHLNSQHRSERPFHCGGCNSTFVSKQNLIVHIKNRHLGESKDYICRTCGKRCASASMLKYHRTEKHLNKRDFRCEICGKGYNFKAALQTHQKVVHVDPSEHPHACNICNKRFAIRVGLENHLKRHMGIKDFICHICSKCFIDNNDLKKHLVSHKADRELLPCTVCKDKFFKTPDGRKRHLFIHHNIGHYTASKKKFVCTLCPKAFNANSKLQKHIRSHTGERPFVCEHCGKRFIDNFGRKTHLKSAHNILLSRDDLGKEIQTVVTQKFGDFIDDDPVISYDEK